MVGSTNRQWTEDELEIAGASREFIQVYMTPWNGRHSVAQELDSGYGGSLLERGEDPSAVGGHFFDALWDGRMADACARADGSNKALLKAVGLWVNPWE